MKDDRSSQLKLFGQNQSHSVNYGWMGTVQRFLDESESTWLDTINRNYQHLYHQQAARTQQHAWKDSSHVMRSQLQHLLNIRPGSATWTLIFEYELPREGGRRPDLVVLGAGQILVIEFKEKASPSAADLDQTTTYARDLAEYHSGSQQHPVHAILVPTRRTQDSESRDRVQILNPHDIADYLNALPEEPSTIDPHAWITAEYAPLPSVVQAAQQIFENEPLPNIRQARSAGIPELLEYLNSTITTAQHNHERHLVLITGVPGSGKTLVGLQAVYQNPFQEAGKRAVFLSGNGPLIQVLQYALKSKVFVQAVRNFYLQHEVRRQTAPAEHLIVFDEAQRAWDRDRMNEKYGISSAAGGAILAIADRIPEWCMVVGLIGEGQEIHVGEEEGIGQWNDGLNQSKSEWNVHCAPDYADTFTAVPPSNLNINPVFNLTLSLRSHLAKDLQTWVAHLLSGEFDRAAQLMPSLIEDGFDAYVTRDLDAAKAYCGDRYREQSSKRYGLLASSRAKNLTQYGIHNDYKSTQRVKVGPWYIDPPSSPLSCCAFNDVVTEFGCQGLELDFPIVGWGDDLLWNHETWVSSVRQRNVRDPLRLRINSYRVLLTRGRDGIIVFVPPERKMDIIHDVLRQAGLRSLVRE